MAKPLKRLLQSSFVQGLAAGAISGYMRLVDATSRWEMRHFGPVQAMLESGQPFVGCFWHGRLLMLPAAWPKRYPLHMLISQHRDGELIARAVGSHGIHTIRGSTAKSDGDGRDKGGRAALRSMIRCLRRREYVGITPDGPRGPRMRVSAGVIAVARLARVPIVPATYSMKHCRILNTWDRFLLPFPFNAGIILWGAPMDVYSDETESPEAAAQRVEAAMNALVAEADSAFGHSPVTPAPLTDTDTRHAPDA